MLTYLQPVISYLGFYHVGANLDLLEEMHNYSYATLFIGLIFNVLLLIFVVVSCLLVYSLLLISVETKKFEIGVMRLVGLTKGGFVGMILTQAAMFVLPAVIAGFAFSVPAIYAIYKLLFTPEMGFTTTLVPDLYSTIQALIIGIPVLSSIIPIQRALSKSLVDALNT